MSQGGPEGTRAESPKGRPPTKTTQPDERPSEDDDYTTGRRTPSSSTDRATRRCGGATQRRKPRARQRTGRKTGQELAIATLDDHEAERPPGAWRASPRRLSREATGVRVPAVPGLHRGRAGQTTGTKDHHHDRPRRRRAGDALRRTAPGRGRVVPAPPENPDGPATTVPRCTAATSSSRHARCSSRASRATRLRVLEDLFNHRLGDSLAKLDPPTWHGTAGPHSHEERLRLEALADRFVIKPTEDGHALVDRLLSETVSDLRRLGL